MSEELVLAVVDQRSIKIPEEVAQIELQASLQEAWALFQERRAEALVVRRMTAPGIRRVYGIITPETVEKSYR